MELNNTKVFIEVNGREVVGDVNDIMLPVSDSSQIYAWCKANNVKATITVRSMGVDLWRIPDPAHRTWFIMRWC